MALLPAGHAGREGENNARTLFGIGTVPTDNHVRSLLDPASPDLLHDLDVDAENAVALAACGRARWNIENGNNNVLKTKGYHLEHNVGHGEKHLANTLASLN